jgi:hypothetical protein
MISFSVEEKRLFAFEQEDYPNLHELVKNRNRWRKENEVS